MSRRAIAMLLLVTSGALGGLEACGSNCGPGGFSLPPTSAVVVRDSSSRDPINDAVVTVTDGDGGFATAVNQGFNGSYRVQVNPGTYSVRVSRTGYTSATATLTVNAGDQCGIAATTLDVALAR